MSKRIKNQESRPKTKVKNFEKPSRKVNSRLQSPTLEDTTNLDETDSSASEISTNNDYTMSKKTPKKSVKKSVKKDSHQEKQHTSTSKKAPPIRADEGKKQRKRNEIKNTTEKNSSIVKSATENPKGTLILPNNSEHINPIPKTPDRRARKDVNKSSQQNQSNNCSNETSEVDSTIDETPIQSDSQKNSTVDSRINKKNTSVTPRKKLPQRKSKDKSSYLTDSREDSPESNTESDDIFTDATKPDTNRKQTVASKLHTPPRHQNSSQKVRDPGRRKIVTKPHKTNNDDKNPKKPSNPHHRKQSETYEYPILQEIRHLQTYTGLIIPRMPFSRLVRDIIQRFKPDFCVTRVALEALQESTEMFLVQFFQDSYMCTQHRGLITLNIKDMELVRRLRGRTDSAAPHH